MYSMLNISLLYIYKSLNRYTYFQNQWDRLIVGCLTSSGKYLMHGQMYTVDSKPLVGYL